jgi:hypothetical protein
MEQWRIEQPQTLDLTGVRRLAVRLVAGSVDVVGRPAPGGAPDAADTAARVEVTQADGPLLVTLDGDTLVVAHERLTWAGLLDWVGGAEARAVVSVAVPAGCPVEVGVVSADAVVSGVAAPTTVKSVSGDVTLDGVRADVTARTVSGHLETRGLAGALRFTTVSGDLTVVDGSSRHVRAETVSGQVTLDLDLPDGGRVELSSVSGDLTLRLPEAAGLQVDVKTLSGDLDSAFDGLTAERKPGRTTLRGRVGSGSAVLQAKTVSGDVTLLPRGAA